MTDLMVLLKNPPFAETEKGNPEQLLQDRTKYSKSVRRYLTVNVKLQQKILAEDLDLDKTIKLGLSLEQSIVKARQNERWKVEKGTEDRIARMVEENVRALGINPTSYEQSSGKCTFPLHGDDRCPAAECECLDCGEMGHFARSRFFKGIK